MTEKKLKWTIKNDQSQYTAYNARASRKNNSFLGSQSFSTWKNTEKYFGVLKEDIKETNDA